MTTVADPSVEREMRTLRVELLNSLRSYREAKSRFSAVTLHYENRYGVGTVEAEFHASSDSRRRTAAVDCDWFRGEEMLAAAALTALCLSERPV